MAGGQQTVKKYSNHHLQGAIMVKKQLLNPNRVRKIEGSFGYIEHRFLRRGFWAGLGHHELLLYFFLIMVADRQGISFYSYDKICQKTGLILEEYLQARDALIDKDLLAFDGYFFQILSLPEKPVAPDNPAEPMHPAVRDLYNRLAAANERT
jgi:hypothetical protein